MADEWHSATSDMAVQQFDVAASKLGIDAERGGSPAPSRSGDDRQRADSHG